MSDTREVTVSGDYPVEMSDAQAELTLSLDTMDRVLRDIDLRTLRHHPRARTEVQRARSAVGRAVHELSLIPVGEAQEGEEEPQLS